MAEVLGVVASAIQVADLGFRLSKNIYEYASNVAGAENRIAYLGQDISLTATIIKELGGVFEDANVQVLLRDSAVSAAKKAMDACNDIFNNMDLALQNSRSSRMAWPFRQVKVQVLNADLDRLKCNLLLLSEALKLARDMRRDEVEKDRFDRLANLIRANTEADARFRDSMTTGNGDVGFPSNNLAVNATLPSVEESPRNSSRSITGPVDLSSNLFGGFNFEDPDKSTSSTFNRSPPESSRSINGAKGTLEDIPLEVPSKREPNLSDPSIGNLDQIEASLKTLIGVIADLRENIEKMDTTPSSRKSKLKSSYLHTRSDLDRMILDGLDVSPPDATGTAQGMTNHLEPHSTLEVASFTPHSQAGDLSNEGEKLNSSQSTKRIQRKLKLSLTTRLRRLLSRSYDSSYDEGDHDEGDLSCFCVSKSESSSRENSREGSSESLVTGGGVGHEQALDVLRLWTKAFDEN